ncbi:MAG: cupredoxin domain-containing protein [Caldilineaceae bacterium]
MFFSRKNGLRALLGVSTLVALWLLVACVPLIRDPHAMIGMNMPPAGGVPALSATGTPAPSLAPSKPQVVIDNFTFTPATITVTVGTTVTWSNQDDTPHTVTEANHLFGSKGLDTDDQYAFRFTAAGVYTYFCSIHPVMIGHVVVK